MLVFSGCVIVRGLCFRTILFFGSNLFGYKIVIELCKQKIVFLPHLTNPFHEDKSTSVVGCNPFFWIMVL